MAEQVRDAGIKKTIEDLEKEITCGICHQHFIDPKCLPCLHSYCKSCIVQLSSAAGSSRPFQCPECRQKIQISGSVESLKTNCIINRLIDTYSSLISEIEMEKCALHDEPKKIFCLDCDQSICWDCILKDGEHKYHDYQHNCNLAPIRKKELEKLVEPLRRVETDFKKAIKDIKSFQSSIISQHDATTKFIEEQFVEFQNVLEKIKNTLLGEVELKMTRKINNLKVQEEELLNTQSRVSQVLQDVDDNALSSSPNRLVSMFGDLKSRIQENLDDCSQDYFDYFDEGETTYANYKLNPVETSCVDVVLQTIPSFFQMCIDKNRVENALIVDDSAAIGNTSFTEEISSEAASFVFYNKDVDADIECHIVTKSGDKKCTVSRVGSITYLVEYKVPKTCGTYNIHLRVNQELVGQRPLILTVKNSHSWI